MLRGSEGRLEDNRLEKRQRSCARNKACIKQLTQKVIDVIMRKKIKTKLDSTKSETKRKKVKEQYKQNDKKVKKTQNKATWMSERQGITTNSSEQES